MTEYPSQFEQSDELPFLGTAGFEQREAYEGDPDSYSVHFYPDGKMHNGMAAAELKDQIQSCQIDLRSDVTRGGKYGVWVGSYHYNLATAAKFSDAPSMQDYYMACRFQFDKDLRKIKIDDDSRGNPSERTDKQVRAIYRAAEIALQRDLLDADVLALEGIFEECGFHKSYQFNGQKIAFISPEADDIIQIIHKKEGFNRTEGFNQIGDVPQKPIDVGGEVTTDNQTKRTTADATQYSQIAIPDIEKVGLSNEQSIMEALDTLLKKLSLDYGSSIRLGFKVLVDDKGIGSDDTFPYDDMHELMKDIAKKINKSDPLLNAWLDTPRFLYKEDENGIKIKMPIGHQTCLIITRCD